MNIIAIAGSRIPSDTANSIQVMKACAALVQLGHNLTLLVPESDERPTPAALQQHYGLPVTFPIEWLSSHNRRLFTLQAVLRARTLSPHALYVWMPQSAVFGLLAGLPTLFEIHIPPSGWLGPAWHRLFARLPGRKRLIAITRALQKILEDDYGMRMPADQVVIAPNGVELERFASLPDPESARRLTGLPPAPTVLCAGHLYAGRGADLFLRLAEAFPQASFVWVGGRPGDVETWRQRSAHLSNVTFTGFLPNRELPRYLAAADVLLMPYERSIFGSSGFADSASVASPMKMFEYMAAGRAILSSDLPVIREVLNEHNAVFCPPEDEAAWRAALGDLLRDPSRRLALAKQAQQDVTQYTWLARARKILADFE